MLRPYFELEQVKKGVFGLATNLYGLQFVKNPDIPVYHPEVEAFDVLDENGQFLAVLYTDFHPRPGKQSGAWMTEFKGQWIKDGVDSRPHISLVMNFTRPTETKPALLTFDEVETFLHEFGHALHGMLSRCTYESLSGTNVYRDFVELPSQIMENWLTEKEYLDQFAFHYQTGENTCRTDTADYRCFELHCGISRLRQLSFGYLIWHIIPSCSLFERCPRIRKKCHSASAASSGNTRNMHLNIVWAYFLGGYVAGYYSYSGPSARRRCFSVFKENGPR